MPHKITFTVEITAETEGEADEVYAELIECAINISNSAETAEVLVCAPSEEG